MLLIRSKILSRSSFVKNSIKIDPDFSFFIFNWTLVPRIEISSFSSEISDLVFVFLLADFFCLMVLVFFEKTSADLTDKPFFNIRFQSPSIAFFEPAAKIARACPGLILFCLRLSLISLGSCNNLNEFVNTNSKQSMNRFKTKSQTSEVIDGEYEVIKDSENKKN